VLAAAREKVPCTVDPNKQYSKRKIKARIEMSNAGGAPINVILIGFGGVGRSLRDL
jgi:hypothetical protein